MLRHLRTVHAPKDLSCSTCSKHFIRQDNLNRHIAEQHNSEDRFIKCEVCSRRVSKRGLPEHLESRICKASRQRTNDEYLDRPKLLCAANEDDCLILTMQVLKKCLTSTNFKPCQTLHDLPALNESALRENPSSGPYSRTLTLVDRALRSLRSEMADCSATRNSLKGFCTAVLWTFLWPPSVLGMSYAMEDAFLQTSHSNSHLGGVAALLKVYHGSSCGCERFLPCQRLQHRAIQDPAFLVFREFLQDTGLGESLLKYTPLLLEDREEAMYLFDVLLQYVINDDVRNFQSLPGRCGGLEAVVWAIMSSRSDNKEMSSSKSG